MNAKTLKKMCVISACTCIGLTSIIMPAIINTSCSQSTEPIIPTEINIYKNSNVTTTGIDNLILDLSNFEISMDKVGVVKFEVSSTNDYVTFGEDQALVEVVPVKIPSALQENYPSQYCEIQINRNDKEGGVSPKTNPDQTFNIKATIYEDTAANFEAN